MSTPQDIVINDRLDLKGALALLQAPHCASATSITLSNLHWDVLSLGDTQTPVPEHRTPCPRPLEIANILKNGLTRLKKLQRLVLVGNDPFTLLPFIQQPPLLVSLDITRTDPEPERWWTDDYDILAKFMVKYSMNKDGPPRMGSQPRARESFVLLRVYDVLLADPANVRAFFRANGISCITHVELHFSLSTPQPRRTGAGATDPEEDYVRALQDVLTHKPIATRETFMSSTWGVYQNHDYRIGRYGGFPAGRRVDGLHIGWHLRWDQGMKQWVKDEARENFLLLEYTKGQVSVKRSGPDGGTMVVVSDGVTLRSRVGAPQVMSRIS
ncbi:unnamed protein product [Cyclocybe aegerita]|uniref:Uncharacterized protein n=1 Tax=Cyclocybe aegerita TaxID=1973307 RepID=A0A8S0XWT8_CYCAE|nr:unnamed protein product [Cyclocybe aegerita]